MNKVFENLYIFILEVETTLFIDFKVNPFLFDQSTIMDLMFYTERIYNLLEDKYKNIDKDNIFSAIIQRLI